MKKLTKLLLATATIFLILAFIGVIGASISKEDSAEQAIFYGLVFYGGLITFFTLSIHLIIVVMNFIIKRINNLDD